MTGGELVDRFGAHMEKRVLARQITPLSRSEIIVLKMFTMWLEDTYDLSSLQKKGR